MGTRTKTEDLHGSSSSSRGRVQREVLGWGLHEKIKGTCIKNEKVGKDETVQTLKKGGGVEDGWGRRSRPTLRTTNLEPHVNSVELEKQRFSGKGPEDETDDRPRTRQRQGSGDTSTPRK